MAPGLGDLLRGLLGGGGRSGGQATAAAPAESYKGYSIVPAPRQDRGMWYVAGSIKLEDAADTREHHFIRADNTPDRAQCVELTVTKARQIIDLEGERMFTRGSDPAAVGQSGAGS